MTLRPASLFATLITGLLATTAMATQATAQKFGTAEIEAATFTGTDLPAGQSALTAKVQVLLDRSGTSPGVIDGFKGGMSESAIRAFERRAGLPVDGVLDAAVWDLLLPYATQPITTDYTITHADAEGLVASIPADYAEKAQMATLGYTSVAEKLGERFHMDEKFIAFLNPGIALTPGATIKVAAPASPIKAQVTRIIIDKTTRRVAGYDAAGTMVVDYPATVGSDATPSPAGNHRVVTIALDPNYTYNPKVNFRQGSNDKVLTIPPGPNGPVGNVWIDLSKPTYGIHGTPTPSQLFVNQSNGCVRLTNWDARELANMVKPGVTTVEFLEPGVTIADVTGGTPAMLPASTTATTTAATITETATSAPAAVTATTLPAAAIREDTTEPDTPAGAPASVSDDALSEALSNALSDGTIPQTATGTAGQ
ncbi:murein L,D-transpeptidase [Paracoccus sp. M683]|nr:L,D-transpeptidase [Paracoccus sp. M683]TRW99456.1 murein L,D-transpeptidase [Paracoccus sp. M683]